MKIGILTYHRSHNYGALLQAYALKTFLNNTGFKEVEFVDYFPEYHRKMYANEKAIPFKNYNLKGKIAYPLYYFKDFLTLYILKEIRRYNFNRFIKKHLIKNTSKYEEKEYDVVIYGSDQIWRKQKKESCPGFNDVYFGNESVKAKHRIAFSASMGIIDLSGSDKNYLVQSMNKFDYISVREKDLQTLLEELTNKDIKHTLDPVFLLPKKRWQDLITKRPISNNYILLYNLQNNQECNDIAQFIHNKTGFEIIEIIGTINKKNYPKNIKALAGPQEFINWIWHSQYVVTSSFHGVALSILFKKQFYTYLKSNSERVTSLLNSIELMDRYITDSGTIDLSESIKYNDNIMLLEKDIVYSERYIIDSITEQ
ncbi:polysaccharide pyruvyl transferase family protein [Natronoflexus pectinivorans]|uniref:Polysaccharide pyruvyl transferase n=1 Tax=Natronoflexus pectinivorans TaxID=682526 RepID=A0A4R2GFT3_9BACT|nr:polysaccharide pyruvyl transferase family protein [Natronoflexus pectinivorans]TCO06903.1 polysaccharide pyruvyl transferase [Natronoflexus pectinivorans]